MYTQEQLLLCLLSCIHWPLWLKGKRCQIPLLAWCFRGKQWLRYSHSLTIWKGSSHRQVLSPKRQNPPCCLTLNHFHVLCIMYPSALKAQGSKQLVVSYYQMGQVMSVQSSFPECNKPSSTTGDGCEDIYYSPASEIQKQQKVLWIHWSLSLTRELRAKPCLVWLGNLKKIIKKRPYWPQHGHIWLQSGLLWTLH